MDRSSIVATFLLLLICGCEGDLEKPQGGARIGANEASAQGSLKCISVGQEQFQAACCIDQNTNGVGECGFLSELGGTKACRGGGQQYESSPYIPSILGKVDPSGVCKKAGYCFILYLPTGMRSATAHGGESVDHTMAEGSYIAYAWPEETGVTGVRLFVIDAQGQPYCKNESPYSGPSDPPPWHAAFSKGSEKGWTDAIDGEGWRPTG
ncbi:MAG: hypothetical protein ACYS47_10010 [Planctomycetota bacterium]|jgi:hypothetical protein